MDSSNNSIRNNLLDNLKDDKSAENINWNKTKTDFNMVSDFNENHVNALGAPLLGDTRDLFRPASKDIPAQPGVYKWRDEEGRVIYVGKAKNLRNRLANYFQPLYQLHPRTQTMVLTARSLEWTVVETEIEALSLEYTWIKEFNPRFNVVFRDDKTYPYLAVSVGEKFPRVWITRNRGSRGAQYFGPYAKVWPLRHSLDSLLKAFPVRTCTSSAFNKARRTGRPCLLASIGKCSAPCVGSIDFKTHRTYVSQLVGVLTGSVGESYLAQLNRDMKQASEELEFERAAKLRDKINLLSTVLQSNSVVLDEDVEADVFGLSSDELEGSVHVFFVRSGIIRGERNWGVERADDKDDTDLLADLLVHLYGEYQENAQIDQKNHESIVESLKSKNSNSRIEETRNAVSNTQNATATDSNLRAKATKMRRERQETTGREDFLAPISPIPREIIVPIAIQDERRSEIESWLTQLRGSKVTIRVPSRGEKRELLERANDNANQALTRLKASRINSLEKRSQAMNEVAKALGLSKSPLRIECYDISNTVDGTYQVASMVVFEDAIAKPSDYRHFAIRGDDGNGRLDDLSAVYETISRRFKHADSSISNCENENNIGSENSNTKNTGKSNHRFAYSPNLIVVDGGREQAKAAMKALEDNSITGVAVCGLSKKLEEVWLPDSDYPIILKRSSEGLYLLQRARDESHRFAITYHRNRRRKGLIKSSLDSIPGIGAVYRKRLIGAFGSVKNLREASVEQLKQVEGIGESKAEIIYDYFKNK